MIINIFCQQISPEEEERRQVRRERNKMAAARCRKRRLDQTNELVEVKIKILRSCYHQWLNMLGWKSFTFIIKKTKVDLRGMFSTRIFVAAGSQHCSSITQFAIIVDKFEM